MKNRGMSLLGVVGLLVAGCETTEVTPVKWKDQTAYLAAVKDPRHYGYSIYQTPRGVEYRGGSRLPSNREKTFSMKVEDPFRPVVMLSGKYGKKAPFLLDFTMETSWMEFDIASYLHAIPVNEREAELIKMPGQEVPGCLSMVPRVHIGKILVENPLFYVRMATGPIGSLTRDIEEPQLKGVMGWDFIKKFDQIHLDYVEGEVALSTAKGSYNQDPALVVARLALVPHAGSCSVRGVVDGKQTVILIDPAGDFEVATENEQPVTTLQLAEGFTTSSPVVSKSPGGTRVGARFLKNYKLIICPQSGAIWFEKPTEE